jgi:8-oxo-dGTP pyrophosphatase MutT (NUDIX family)
MTTRAEGTHAVLADWTPSTPEQAALRDEYLVFVDEHGAAALDRDGGPEHLTASCFVLTPAFDKVLLSFHRKGRFWVQLGGHVEASDGSLGEAALREAREEGGIEALTLWSVVPVDVDRHGLGDGFARCSVHWDVGFVAFAAPDAVPTVSDESEDVRWFPVAALPDVTPAGFPARLSAVLAAARA